MMYRTLFFGAPYGFGGEFGRDMATITAADVYAKRKLQPGQRMGLLDDGGCNPVIARWTCDGLGHVNRVVV